MFCFTSGKACTEWTSKGSSTYTKPGIKADIPRTRSIASAVHSAPAFALSGTGAAIAGSNPERFMGSLPC